MARGRGQRPAPLSSSTSAPLFPGGIPGLALYSCAHSCCLSWQGYPGQNRQAGRARRKAATPANRQRWPPGPFGPRQESWYNRGQPCQLCTQSVGLAAGWVPLTPAGGAFMLFGDSNYILLA